MKCYKVILIASALTASSNINAAIIDNGTYTTDTASGLDWLDLTATAGMSYNEVSAQLGSGGILEGWSYASLAQVGELWTALGGNPAYYNDWSTQNNGLFEVIAPLFGDLGCNSRGDCNPGEGYSYWMTGDMLSGRARFATSFDLWYYGQSSTQDRFSMSVYDAVDLNNASLEIGSALVRVSAVPIPSAIWLFGTGFLGLLGIARNKKA